MGSMIELYVGELSIDWGKNTSFFDHRPLFRPDALKKWKYNYIDDDGSPIVESKPALVTTLAEARHRLELLGISRNIAEQSVQAAINSQPRLDRGNQLQVASVLTALSELDLTHPAPGTGYEGLQFGDLARAVAPKIIRRRSSSWDYFVKRVIDSLHPWCVLRILADVPTNASVPVVWGFADVAEGWVEPRYFVEPLSRDHRFLIVTEGSSDAAVVKRSLSLLRGKTADFFEFIDMNQGYPFTGTGNMKNFLKGLASIGFSRKLIAIFDNDVEGVETYHACKAFPLPSSTRLMLLPDRVEFKCFPTVGPGGEHKSDINGCAASIECYLDLRHTRTPARVRWTNYRPGLDRWQGVIEGKDEHVREFLKKKDYNDYDFSGLEDLLGRLFNECASLAETLTNSDRLVCEMG